MEFYSGYYYHIYNRANSEKEKLFVEAENYLFFLRKYREYLMDILETLCYCFLPNHFHFFVRVKDRDYQDLKGFQNLSGLMDSRRMDINQAIGNFLNSYTKSFNKKYKRRGSLFEKPTKSKRIDNDVYFINMARYIHRNPIHHNLITSLEDWPYSSYWEYIGLRKGTLPNTTYILSQFQDVIELRKFTETEEEDVTLEKYIIE